MKVSFRAERLAALQVLETADCKRMASTTPDSQCHKQAACREDRELQKTQAAVIQP